MGRIMLLSVASLLILRGTSFALPESASIEDFYGAPSSGALAATTDTDVHDASQRAAVLAPAQQFCDRDDLVSNTKANPLRFSVGAQRCSRSRATPRCRLEF